MADISIIPAPRTPAPSPSPSQSGTPANLKSIIHNPLEEPLIKELLSQQKEAEKMISLLQNPNIQSKLSAGNTLQLMNHLREIHSPPTVYYFYGLEAAWLVSIFAYKAWKKFRSPTFLTYLWFQFYTGVIYILVAAIGIPLLFLSTQDRQALYHLISSFF